MIYQQIYSKIIQISNFQIFVLGTAVQCAGVEKRANAQSAVLNN